MTQTGTTTDRYVSEFEAFERSVGGQAPDWLRDLRRQAIARFQQVGLPTARKGNEPWKYTNIAPVAGATFTFAPAVTVARSELPAQVPHDDIWRTLVFVNGRYSAELSTPGAGVSSSIHQVVQSDGSVLHQRLANSVAEDDGFASLNTAFLHDGAFVETEAESVVDAPLHIVHLAISSGERLVCYPRTIIVVRPNSKLSVIETYATVGDGVTLSDAVTEIVLEDGAQIDHYRLLLDNHQSFHIGKTRVHQRRGSSLRSLTFEAGAALGRSDVEVRLDEPGAECSLNGLYVTSGSQHIDNYINIDHAAPRAKSRLYYKGILDDSSRAAFGGRVLVREGAVKTDSHQEDKNLLLSDEAEADSKPSLEIYADDVICGHGATAGAITDDALFYIQSRGLDEDSARVLLVKGFASEILERVAIDSLRAHLEKLTPAALPRFQDQRINDNE